MSGRVQKIKIHVETVLIQLNDSVTILYVSLGDGCLRSQWECVCGNVMGLLDRSRKFNTHTDHCISTIRRRSTIHFGCTVRMRIKYTDHSVRGTRISFAHQSIHWCGSSQSQRKENSPNTLHTMACRALDTNLKIQFSSIAVINHFLF